MDKLGNIWLNYFEPKAEPLCKETRDMLKNCVSNSKCYANTQDFKSCIQEKIDPDCIPYRKRYSACKRLAVDRTKDFRSDGRSK